MVKNKNFIVISLGGSLIVPDEIDAVFIKNFRDLIVGRAKKGFKFIIVCGGGKMARKYQNAAKSIAKISNEDADWLAILATRINAALLKSTLGELAHPDVIENPFGKIDFGKKVILFSGGWKPGFSTDYLSVLLAKRFRAEKVLNLTNIDYVYDKDPKKFKDAKQIKNIYWKKLKNIEDYLNGKNFIGTLIKKL